MNSTNTANMNSTNIQKKVESKEEAHSDDLLKKEEEIRDAKYLTNKYKFDFPEDGMSQFQFMLLKHAINKYEESRPITRPKEYKRRHGLLS
jgi:hypothetical protein